MSKLPLSLSLSLSLSTPLVQCARGNGSLTTAVSSRARISPELKTPVRMSNLK